MPEIKLGPVTFRSNKPLASIPQGPAVPDPLSSWDEAKRRAGFEVRAPRWLPDGFTLGEITGEGLSARPSESYPVSVGATYRRMDGDWLRVEQVQVRDGRSGLREISVEEPALPVQLGAGPAVAWSTRQDPSPGTTSLQALAWSRPGVFTILTSPTLAVADLAAIADHF